MNIRLVNANEYPELMRLVSRSFEYPEYEQIDRDFPHLFAPENHNHLWVAYDGKLLGHAGAWFTRLRVNGTAWPVGGVGGVCTIPEARGKGIATKLVQKACEDLKARGAVLAFLWSGQHEFYRGLGFETVGRQWSISIPHDGPRITPKNLEFKLDKSEDFFMQSLLLLAAGHMGVERSPALHRLLLGSPGCAVYSAWRGSTLVAYCVVNKGRDLGDHIHEWAGDSNVLKDLIPWVAQKIGRPHTLLAPQLSESEAPFIFDFDKQGFAVQTGVMGLAKVIAPAVLAELVNQKMGEALQIKVRPAMPKVPVSYVCKTQEQEIVLSETQLVSFLFGAGGDSVEGLPIRLWWWGMESV
jgi:predicted N-acetyltransferase YhbS